MNEGGSTFSRQPTVRNKSLIVENKMKKPILFAAMLVLAGPLYAQQSEAGLKQPETFTMEWADSTIVMQKYFVAFLKRGPERSQGEEAAARIQKEHLAHLAKLYEEGKTSLTGPFGDDGDIRGIVVFNTATIEEARELAGQDPAVKAGRLVIEIHPWWTAKGGKLR